MSQSSNHTKEAQEIGTQSFKDLYHKIHEYLDIVVTIVGILYFLYWLSQPAETPQRMWYLVLTLLPLSWWLWRIGKIAKFILVVISVIFILSIIKEWGKPPKPLTAEQKKDVTALARVDMDPVFREIARAETNGQHTNPDGSVKTSSTGCIGLFQICPETHKEMLTRHNLDPTKLADNIRAAEILYCGEKEAGSCARDVSAWLPSAHVWGKKLPIGAKFKIAAPTDDFGPLITLPNSGNVIVDWEEAQYQPYEIINEKGQIGADNVEGRSSILPPSRAVGFKSLTREKLLIDVSILPLNRESGRMRSSATTRLTAPASTSVLSAGGFLYLEKSPPEGGDFSTTFTFY